jgi:hypothetical protein
MTGLLKNITKWTVTLIVCLLSVSCILSSAEPTPNVYLFRKNTTSSKLTFVRAISQELGFFDANNTICAQLQRFRAPTNDPQNWHVVGLDDVIYQRGTIFSAVPPNSKFPVVDSATGMWYITHNGDFIALVDSSEYEAEKSQLSNVCYYVDDVLSFIILPEDIEYGLTFSMAVISAVVCMTAFIAVIVNSYLAVNTKVGFEKSMRIFRISLIVWFLVFCAAVSYGVLPDFILNRCTLDECMYKNRVVTYFSISSNWNMTLVTIIFLVDLIIIAFKSRTNNEFADETKPITNSGFAAEDGFYESLRKMFRISLIIGIVLIVICASLIVCLLFGSDIFGPDNISRHTGHFYVNTLMESVDTISTNIRNM